MIEWVDIKTMKLTLFFKSVKSLLLFSLNIVIWMFIRLSVTYIELDTGSKLLVYKGYTFCKHTTGQETSRYKCSNTLSARCKAFVHIRHDDTVAYCNVQHSHKPAIFVKNKDGTYKKIRSSKSDKLAFPVWMNENL